MKTNNHCINCGVSIKPKSTRCYSCAQKGKLNTMWKGDNVKYRGLHDWIRKRKPKPEVCDECKQNQPYDLANISGEYKRDVNDFEWLCRDCHMTKDDRRRELIKRNKARKYLQNKNCLFCGKEFPVVGDRRRKYCSKICSNKSRLGEKRKVRVMSRG